MCTAMGPFSILGEPPFQSQMQRTGEVSIGIPTLTVAHTTAICWLGVGSRCSEEGERCLQGHLPGGTLIHIPSFIHPSIHPLLRVYDMPGALGSENKKASLFPQRGLGACTYSPMGHLHAWFCMVFTVSEASKAGAFPYLMRKKTKPKPKP